VIRPTVAWASTRTSARVPRSHVRQSRSDHLRPRRRARPRPYPRHRLVRPPRGPRSPRGHGHLQPSRRPRGRRVPRTPLGSNRNTRRRDRGGPVRCWRVHRPDPVTDRGGRSRPDRGRTRRSVTRNRFTAPARSNPHRLGAESAGRVGGNRVRHRCRTCASCTARRASTSSAEKMVLKEYLLSDVGGMHRASRSFAFAASMVLMGGRRRRGRRPRIPTTHSDHARLDGDRRPGAGHRGSPPWPRDRQRDRGLTHRHRQCVHGAPGRRRGDP